MSIANESELIGLQRVIDAIALTLKRMKKYAQAGMSTRELDDYGGQMLEEFGAKSVPQLTYGFPGWTCISVNN